MSESVAEYWDAGSGEDALVLLHGLGGDLTNWAPQLVEFSTEYRCIAWTLPGYGDSPRLDDMSWPALADAVARMLDDANLSRASIVGLSMGGYIAQQFAVDHPDRVDRLVLAATSAQFGRGSQSFADKFLASRLAPLDEGKTPADFAARVAASLMSDDAPSRAIGNCTASMSGISPDAYRRALELLVTWDLTERLSEIAAPTLCVAGADDRTAPVAALRALAEAIPNAALAVIEDCNHLINLDRPAEFNLVLRRFLT